MGIIAVVFAIACATLLCWMAGNDVAQYADPEWVPFDHAFVTPGVEYTPIDTWNTYSVPTTERLDNGWTRQYLASGYVLTFNTQQKEL